MKLSLKNPFLGGTDEAILHFVKGGLRYAFAASLYYATVRLASLHVTTPEAILAVGIVDRLLKSLYVKFTTGPDDTVVSPSFSSDAGSII